MGVISYFDSGDYWRRIEGMLDDPEDLLKAAGITVQSASQQAFVDQKWDGKPWPERMTPNWAGIIADLMNGSPQPKAGRTERGKALFDTGTLFGSIAFDRIEQYAVMIGSNVEYASKHQAGEETEIGPWSSVVRKKLWMWMKKQSKEIRKDLGWLLNKKWLDEPVVFRVSQRKFVGMTDEIREDIHEAVADVIARA